MFRHSLEKPTFSTILFNFTVCVHTLLPYTPFQYCPLIFFFVFQAATFQMLFSATFRVRICVLCCHFIKIIFSSLISLCVIISIILELVYCVLPFFPKLSPVSFTYVYYHNHFAGDSHLSCTKQACFKNIYNK